MNGLVVEELTPFGVRQHGTKATTHCQVELTGDVVLDTLNSIEPSTTLQPDKGAPW